MVYVGIKLKIMSKDPAVLFYTGDFLNGCVGLTMEERGQYITLLCLQHQSGHLSLKTIKLAVGTISDDVLKKFSKDISGNYFNERMGEEIEKRISHSRKQRENIEKRWKSNDKNIPSTIPNEYQNDTKEDPLLYEDININEDVKELFNSVVIFFDENCRPKTDREKFKWYDELDKLIRIDKKEPDKVKQVIKKARMDDFWCKNFMSVLKLRKKNKEGIPYFIVFENKFFGKEVKNNIPQFFSGPKK